MVQKVIGILLKVCIKRDKYTILVLVKQYKTRYNIIYTMVISVSVYIIMLSRAIPRKKA